MNLRTWLVQGRAVLLVALLAAVAVGTVLLAGCEDGGNPGGGGNNCTSAENCKQVTIGGVTWMAENLNIKTGNSWCNRDTASYCRKYGRLYDWETARTACPAGWHLPSSAEWDALVDYAGGSSVAGKKLKSKTGWNAYSGIVNEDAYGFSALPGGSRIPFGGFSSAGGEGFWWTATENEGGRAYCREMKGSGDFVAGPNIAVSNGFSVRCVAD